MIRSDDEAYYEAMRDALPRRCARRPPWRPARPSRSTFSGGAMTMNNNRVLAERFRANMAAYGIDDQGDDPNAGSTDMANVSWVCPTIHPDLAIAPEGTPGHSILFRDAAATSPQGRRDDAPGGDRSSPRPPTTCSATRRSSRPPGRVPRRADAVGRGATIAAARPAGRRFRTGGAPSETDLTAARPHPPRPSPEDLRG